jgi:predicted 3-demethylubiquinone-9 3-methyltransferase (glyoxalase superfamily)
MPARRGGGIAKPARKAAKAKPKPAAKGARATRSSRSVVAVRASASSTSAVTSITPFVWFDDDFHEAAKYYVGLFPNSRVEALHPMGGTIVLAGQRILGLNGGPTYSLSPAFSLFVVCKDQKEVDRLWNRLEGDGGTPSRCGWIDDKFGLTWQIIPQAFLDLTGDPDPKKVGAVFEAMMGMVKMDVKGLQAAYDAA